ncbi:MAG TPA: glycosyltransferase family 2 protein [Ferruginibacter sp.]|nr:glycosyltransferase family 2 protein [Ferruginibacter sp.]HMP21260.1 glycosyltransferase family 2 protein [Ferruginibacter sp.]
MSEPLISVVMPVKNGGDKLRQALEAIFKQTLIHQTEVVVVDSGSDAYTMDILRQYPVRLFQISPASFNHGGTRNYGVQQAGGKYVVLTVQDAVPVDENWLQHLLNGFVEDDVAAVCGQQVVPHSSSNNPVEWFRPVSTPVIRQVQYSPGSFERLSPAEQRRQCKWDDVNACYRRDVLMQYPYRQVQFGEDVWWAKDALSLGLKLVYNTHAQVYHYHFEDAAFIKKRTLIEWFTLYEVFNLQPSKPAGVSFKKLLSWSKAIFFAGNMSFAKKINWLRYNIKTTRLKQEIYSTWQQAVQQGRLHDLGKMLYSDVPMPQNTTV